MPDQLSFRTMTRRSLLLGAGTAGLVTGIAWADGAFTPPPIGAADAKHVALRFATSYAGMHPMTQPGGRVRCTMSRK